MKEIKQKPYFDKLPPIFQKIHKQKIPNNSCTLGNITGNQCSISIITDFYKNACNLIDFDNEDFEIIS